MHTLLLAALVLSAALAGSFTHADAALRVFVTNEKSDDVTVIDAASDAVVKKIDVPKNPRGMRFTPDSRRLFVASEAANEVSMIDVAAWAVVKSVATGGTRPVDVRVTADGKRLYVSHGGSAEV